MHRIQTTQHIIHRIVSKTCAGIALLATPDVADGFAAGGEEMEGEEVNYGVGRGVLG